MKKLFLIVLCLAIIVPINNAHADVVDDVIKDFQEPAPPSSRLMTWGGYRNELSGYTDKRYVGSDKGDYLSAKSFFLGTEYVSSVGAGDYIMGGNFVVNYRNKFYTKSLYSVPSYGIDKEKVPKNAMDKVSNLGFNLGVFTGIQKKFIGFDFGLSFKFKTYYEKSREYLRHDGTIKKVDGRGWRQESGSFMVLPTFLFRLGQSSKAHFSIGFLREDYDPKYGQIDTKVFVPLSSVIFVKIGGYLWPTNSIYLEPGFMLSGFMCSFKVGTIVNYNDKKFKSVGLGDGMFVGINVTKDM